MEVIVNIGLAVGTNKHIGPGTALRELQTLNFKIIEHAVHHSDTELTVIARVRHTGDPIACANWVAQRLHQDCIAVYNPATGKGALIGPRAAEWGKFNPEFFFNIDGTRLASAALPRAA